MHHISGTKIHNNYVYNNIIMYFYEIFFYYAVIFYLIMNNNLELIDRIKFVFKQIKITAYEVAAETSLTEVGINKILNGQSKNPRKATLNILFTWLSNERGVSKLWLDEGVGNMIISENTNVLDHKIKLFNQYGKDISDDEIAAYIIQNEERLLKNSAIKLWIKTIAQDLLIKHYKGNK